MGFPVYVISFPSSPVLLLNPPVLTMAQVASGFNVLVSALFESVCKSRFPADV